LKEFVVAMRAGRVMSGQPWALADQLNKREAAEEEKVLLGSFGLFDGHRMAENERLLNLQ
jgi:3-hydroxy-3-methylglutaryl CoA synthase